MKTFYIYIILCIAIITIPCKAQLTANAGILMNDSLNAGFHAGITAKVKFLPRFGFSGGVNYVQQRRKNMEGIDVYKYYDVNNVNATVLFHYYPFLNEPSSIFAGIQDGLIISKTSQFNNLILDKHQLYYVFGASFVWDEDVEFIYRYNLGMANSMFKYYWQIGFQFRIFKKHR